MFVVHPTPQLTISTIPNSGPVVGMLYTVICSVTKPANGVLSVEWKNSNGLLVKTFGNIHVGSPVQTDIGANLTLEFSKVTVVDEGIYVCYSSLILENYQLTVSDFMPIDVTAPGKQYECIKYSINILLKDKSLMEFVSDIFFHYKIDWLI